MFNVEKGHVIPPKARRNGRVGKYPWLEMNPGDSFFVYNMKKHTYLLACAKSFAKRNGLEWVFETRPVESGVRIWRTK